MNTIISIPSKIPAELNQGGTSTSEKVFQDSSGNAVVLPFPSAGQLCGPNGPSKSQVAHIKIHARGRVEGGTTANYTPQLQWGTSATPTSNTDIESGGAVAVNSVKGLWFLEADLFVDNDSGKMTGFARFGVYGSTNSVTDWTVIDNTITGVDADGGTVQGFVVTGTFSAGNAGNKAYLDEFNMELVA